MTQPYEDFVELVSVVEMDVPRLLPFSCLTGREWCVGEVANGLALILTATPHQHQESL